MYSPIPASLLFWSIPFLFTPATDYSAYFSGQSYAEFSEFKMGLKQAKNFGLELKNSRLADFGQQTIAASTGVSIHEQLSFNAGLQFIRSFQSSASHTQVHVNTSLLFSQELTQSLGLPLFILLGNPLYLKQPTSTNSTPNGALEWNGTPKATPCKSSPITRPIEFF